MLYFCRLWNKWSSANIGLVYAFTLYPFSCNAILKVSQMSGSSSTITIDLDDDDDDDETQLVAWVNDLLTSLNFDVYYHRTHILMIYKN